MEAPRGGVTGNPWTRLPTWAKWTISVVGVLALLIVGAFIGGSEEDDLKAEVTQLTRERNEAETKAAAVASRKAEILQTARGDAALIVGEAESERSQAAGRLRKLRNEANAAQGELSEAESSLAGAEEEAALSEITDGIWKAELDYIPGTYRAPGGEACYWAMLNSANPGDIAENEIGSGPQLAEITSPYFQTKGCGTWEKVE